MKRTQHWLAFAVLGGALVSGCYGTYGPDGPQPYGTAGPGVVLPKQGQEIEHDYGRSCVIKCNAEDYYANCPKESRAVCQCESAPHAVCK